MRPIDADRLYEKMKNDEDLARQRVIDTPNSFLNGLLNPAAIRYTAQLSERTRFKTIIYDAPTVSLEPEWIPILDGDGQMPEVDEEGYSDYILLSFRNASFLCIGQYREDEEGGAFYDGDDENPLTKMGLFVNAWMPLPERYKGNEDV